MEIKVQVVGFAFSNICLNLRMLDLRLSLVHSSWMITLMVYNKGLEIRDMC